MQFSPRSKMIKRFVKAPMVFNVISLGLMAAMSTLGNKLVGEMVVTGDIWIYWLPFGFMGLFSFLLFPQFILCGMNRNLMFYQSMEVMPCFQASVVVFWNYVGSLILLEMAHATPIEKAQQYFGIFLIVVGVFFLVRKGGYKKQLEKEKAKGI